MSKVKLDVIKPWITTKITQILGMEDDVVIEFVNNQLEEKVRDIIALNKVKNWIQLHLIRRRYLYNVIAREKAISNVRVMLHLAFSPHHFRKSIKICIISAMMLSYKSQAFIIRTLHDVSSLDNVQKAMRQTFS
jgi:uncharacterized membrane protein